MIRALANSQSAHKEELLAEIKKTREEFDGLEKRVTKVERAVV